MNRQPSPVPQRPAVLIEALEPRIAPAGLLNESKFTSVAVGGSLLLDAGGAPGTFQGLTTGSGGGSGSYLLYIASGRALVFTTDINGNGRLDPGEVTGIALGKDALGHDPALTLFSDVNGDIVTNLEGTRGATLTDSDQNPNNGRDGQVLTDTNIASLTLRTLTAADINPSIPGNTVNNRLALTSFSIHGNVVAGGNIGAVTIDTAGTSLLSTKFSGSSGDQLFTGAIPTIGGLYTGTAANDLSFHFTQNNPSNPQVQGIIQPFHPPALEHGGDITHVAAASTATAFSIGTLATGDGGSGARGGNLDTITLDGVKGGYQLIAGNGGDGASGGQGGSILHFNDLGSVTGQVILRTGDGGTGLLGTGGTGGLATFATTNIAAQVQVIMGRGGDGFMTGGDGASFTSGNFVTPETVIPVGGKFYGTWHNIGDVGNTHPLVNAAGTLSYAPEVLDFNGDGAGDGVFTTTLPDAVNVVFGNGVGGLLDGAGNFNGTNSTTVSLKVPGVTNPVVTIGDFNGDGRPDIAVASGDPLNTSGIYVFLDQIGTAFDPINSRNFTHSLVGDHPFSAALQSALPSLAAFGVYQTSGGLVALTSGDFNGDGLTDIAYVQNVTEEVTLKPFQTIGVLLGGGVIDPLTRVQQHDAASGKLVGSGYFYANPAASRAAPTLLNTIVNVNTDFLQATSLNSRNLPDATSGLPAAAEVFLYAAQGEKQYASFSVTSLVDPATHAANDFLRSNPVGLGQVDTNRNLGGTSIALTDATLQEFTIQDINQDGFADVVVLTKGPANFLVDFKGNGNNQFAVASNPNDGGDNSGIALGTNITTVAITPVDTNTAGSGHAGTFDGVGILTLPNPPGPTITEYLLQDTDGTPSFYRDNGNPVGGRVFFLPTPIQDQTVLALDTFYATAPTLPTPDNPNAEHPAAGYGGINPESTDYKYTDFFIAAAPGSDPTVVPTFPTFIRYLTENGYVIHAGDGGSSVTAAGGNAGVIGGLAKAIGISLPASLTYEGQAFLQGGNGGGGFGGGGFGGDVSGVVVTYPATATLLTSDVQLAAGNGGNGIGGDGGRGGNLSLLSIQSGTFFSAGNAGSGLHGGTGGSITGNQTSYDTLTPFITLISGNGGEGSLGGGDGGTISKWDTRFNSIIGTTGGLLDYTTGAGGGAAGGVGGAGGSILNSSPDQTLNNLSGPLRLTTGVGGSGLTGGNGGAIDTFVNSLTGPSALPTELRVVTGAGGIGVSGTGGTGGAINGFSSNATGLSSLVGESLTGIGRIIAGNGGTSYGAAGGVGGSITNVTATTTSAPLVVAAGAGGDGLTIGGDGGSVTNSTINSAALRIGKLLVVAGKGGDALAAQPQDISLPGDTPTSDTADLAHTVLAFGNVRGLAGNGGDIMRIVQPVGAQTAVDLIAGNGGNTPNASTALTNTTGVGRGGSVVDVTLTGTVGAISRDTTLGAASNPAIQAYAVTDEFGVTTTLPISAIIDLLANPENVFGSVNDNQSSQLVSAISGNVGILAGAAGTLRPSPVTGIAQPARDGVNGDVTGITAASIMSIVAGSVSSVAPVRILSGIVVTNADGVLGADKSPASPYAPNGQLNYFTSPTATTTVTTLNAGYSLVGPNDAAGNDVSGDGAFFASTIISTADNQIRGPRVFTAQS